MCSKKINIFFLPEDEILIRWYETPGKGMIMEGLESITEEISNNFLYGPSRAQAAWSSFTG